MLKETKEKRREKTNQRETLSQNINLPMVPLAETKANILAGVLLSLQIKGSGNLPKPCRRILDFVLLLQIRIYAQTSSEAAHWT